MPSDPTLPATQPADDKLCLVCGRRYAGMQKCPKDGASLVPLKREATSGQIIGGNYEIIELIGKGGMSIVYRARHMLMKRVVAVKVLTAQDPHSVKRFHVEAQLAASLNHPNIVTVYDFGVSEQGEAFLAMEPMEGRTLSAIVSAEGPMAYRKAVSFFVEACEALVYAHGRGVIHRDLKPSNLMAVENPTKTATVIKLLDFGIAKQLEQSNEMSQLTASGQVFGSPLYMSPEQCVGLKVDARADIYSFGCCMYEVLCGRPPFIGVSPLDTMQMHVHSDAKPFRQINPRLDIPRQLEHIVLKSLERDIHKRYQTATDLLTDLKFFVEQLKVEDAAAAAAAAGVPIEQSRAMQASSGGKPVYRRPAKDTFEVDAWTTEGENITPLGLAPEVMNTAPARTLPQPVGPEKPAGLQAPQMGPGPASVLPTAHGDSAAIPAGNNPLAHLDSATVQAINPAPPVPSEGSGIWNTGFKDGRWETGKNKPLPPGDPDRMKQAQEQRKSGPKQRFPFEELRSSATNAPQIRPEADPNIPSVSDEMRKLLGETEPPKPVPSQLAPQDRPTVETEVKSEPRRGASSGSQFSRMTMSPSGYESGPYKKHAEQKSREEDIPAQDAEERERKLWHRLPITTIILIVLALLIAGFCAMVLKN